ncbi:MAG: SusD/RagB family nutrient-binding outer membrane lipoprotein [Saprospiraceae bacterium]|nr:SusD/RagB family nutrient-binding outer membrane lipoprotein [Saprospiraceae bacterium]
MKHIKYFIATLLLLTAFSCGKNFGDLNTDPNNPGVVPAEYLLTNAQKAFADQHGGNPLVYSAGLWGQYWAQNNYTDASRYAYGPGGWAWYYAEILEDLREIQRLVGESDDAASAKSQNQLAVAKILEVAVFHDLTDLFGPVPFAEALEANRNRTPQYDSQQAIYQGLLRDLKAAMAQIDESAGSFGPGDVIYGGDMTKWKAFGQSLRLRIGIRMADVDAATAQAEVEDAAAGAFTGNADNAAFRYRVGQPNNHPLNQLRVERGDADWGMSDVLIDKTMLPLNDPRLPAFADEKVIGGGYKGRPFGQNNGNAAAESPDLYSQPSGAAVIRAGTGEFKSADVLAPDALSKFMSYAEVCFIMAEAKERNWNVPGTAAEWYHAGIAASLEEWGVTDQTAIDAYIAQPLVTYATAPGDWKQKIGVQKWIALYTQGIQGWCEWRRLDFDKLELPEDGALFDIGDKVAPVRLIYPVDEQTQNQAGYQQGVSLLGGPDRLFTRVWWDVE